MANDLERTAGLHTDAIQLVHLRHTFTEDIFESIELVHECQRIVDRAISTAVSCHWNFGTGLIFCCFRFIYDFIVLLFRRYLKASTRTTLS